MDVPEEPVTGIRRERGGAEGVALPVSLFVILIVAILGTGVWVSIDLNARATANREETTSAVQLAEAGAAHALGLLRTRLKDTSFTRLLRGDDGEPGTGDDGDLAGFGLPPEEEIPPGGRSLGSGIYLVRVVDDAADADGDSLRDSNQRVVLRSTGAGGDGASAAVEVVVGGPGAPRGVLVDGKLEMEGSAQLLGSCQGLHSNRELKFNGNLTVQGPVTASREVEQKGSLRDPDGNPVVPLEHQPERDVPRYDPAVFCGAADYVLRSDGFVEERATGTLYDARETSRFGWKFSGSGPVVWQASGDDVRPGTYCVEGNAEISGNPGKDDGPLPLSLVATGSVNFSGTPVIAAAHPDGVLILAGGDVVASGNPSAGFDNYTGLIYAGSQCSFGGNARYSSSIICHGDPEPGGAIDYVDKSRISGNSRITDPCAGSDGSPVRRVTAWLQRFGR